MNRQKVIVARHDDCRPPRSSACKELVIVSVSRHGWDRLLQLNERGTRFDELPEWLHLNAGVPSFQLQTGSPVLVKHLRTDDQGEDAIAPGVEDSTRKAADESR